MDAIKVVMFDADGVLQFWRNESELRQRFAEEHGWDKGQFDRLQRGVFGSDEFGKACLIGAADWPPHVGALLQEVAWTGTVEAFLEIWLGWATLVSEEALEVVRDLRAQGTVCALATNQEAWRARHMDEVLGFADYFDRLFYSCRVGYSKPDPAFFRAVVQELKVPAREILFIDDNEANVSSARSCGINAEQLRPGDDLREVVATATRKA